MRDRGASRESGMTVDEAARIIQQFEAGALDPALPGTMDLVNEARRVGVTASLWGTENGHPFTRRRRQLVIACCSVASITIIGLTLVFVTSH